ncbi:MAG: Cell division protein FtsH [Gemmataceae bacterium]|nr:Cell division protein FtsH [Gemmataceae bacterium]
MPLLTRPDELSELIAPTELAALAYPAAVAEVGAALLRRLPCLVECPKEVVPFFAQALRAHLKPHNLRCIPIDGRA